MKKQNRVVGFGNFDEGFNDRPFKKDLLSTENLNEIIEMARRGKSMREIAEFLDPDNITQLMRELGDKNTELGDAFRLGIASMGPDIKLLAAQAEIETINLNRQIRVDELIADFIGDNITD
jgi:hypothetical protein